MHLVEIITPLKSAESLPHPKIIRDFFLFQKAFMIS